MSNAPLHIPVMLSEVIDGLSIVSGKWYIDATFGRGGHTEVMLSKGANVIAIDQDQDAISYAHTMFVQAIEQKQLIVIHSNFEYLSTFQELAGKEIAGILFDFGLSSVQLDEGARGFSFQSDAPLDMRMDKNMAVTAKDLVNGLSKKELMYLLEKFAQESYAHGIADAIVKARANGQIQTTKELASIIEKARGRANGHIHPATKTFMALRMAVNDELGSIERSLPIALDLLTNHGRLVTISFHEGEDRIVKNYMKEWQARGMGSSITKKPLMPDFSEVSINPRSRSAKVRIFEKGLRQ